MRYMISQQRDGDKAPDGKIEIGFMQDSHDGIGSSVLLDVVHPRLASLCFIVCLPEQFSLPFV